MSDNDQSKEIQIESKKIAEELQQLELSVSDETDPETKHKLLGKMVPLQLKLSELIEVIEDNNLELPQNDLENFKNLVHLNKST